VSVPSGGAPAIAANERTGLAALLFHDLLQQEELFGVAIPPMLMSALVDPVHRHGSQFLKLATVVAQRRDTVRDTVRVLQRLTRVGQNDRLSRADLQKLLRTSRLLECASVSTPSAPPHASLALRGAAAAASADTSKWRTDAPSDTLAANLASWNDVTRAAVTSDEVTLLAYVIAQSAAPDVGWATTQANRIADLITKLLIDRNGLRVLTLMSKTQSETQMGVANVASERWLVRSYSKRAALLVHLTWTAASISMRTHLVDAPMHLPTRTTDPSAPTTLDDSAQINAQAFLRGTVWDFAVSELRDLVDARDRAAQPCMPATEFVRVLQHHLDAAALRGVPRALSVDGSAQPVVVWAISSRFRGPAPPASARSIVMARVCPIVEGQVSAEDLLGYLARRTESSVPQLVRSLVPLGVGNAVGLFNMITEKTLAQLPSTYEFNVVAATVAPRVDDVDGTKARLALVLLCTPRMSVELGAGADLSSARLGSSRRELSLPDACALCLSDVQERLQTVLRSAAADYRCDRLWSLMIEPLPRRDVVAGQPAPLTFADFVDVGSMLQTIEVGPMRGGAASASMEPAAQPRSLLRLSGAELVEQLLRSPVMQPWRDVMVMATQRFGTVRKDGTVRRATIFLADEQQPQLVVFDTACPTSLVLLSAGAARSLHGGRLTDDGAPDLARALAQQRSVIDGARLCICHRDATDAPLSDAVAQLTNDFVQFLLACMWFRLAGRSLEANASSVSSTSATTAAAAAAATAAATTTSSKIDEQKQR
jgi:hypothetical protein